MPGDRAVHRGERRLVPLERGVDLPPHGRIELELVDVGDEVEAREPRQRPAEHRHDRPARQPLPLPTLGHPRELTGLVVAERRPQLGEELLLDAGDLGLDRLALAARGDDRLAVVHEGQRGGAVPLQERADPPVPKLEQRREVPLVRAVGDVVLRDGELQR